MCLVAQTTEKLPIGIIGITGELPAGETFELEAKLLKSALWPGRYPESWNNPQISP
jgi:hypothetical protein